MATIVAIRIVRESLYILSESDAIALVSSESLSAI